MNIIRISIGHNPHHLNIFIYHTSLTKYERTGRIMKIWKKIKGKLPVVVTLCCCLAVAGLSALVKGDGKAVEVSTGANQKQVVIIDAGHGGYVLN